MITYSQPQPQRQARGAAAETAAHDGAAKEKLKKSETDLKKSGAELKKAEAGAAEVTLNPKPYSSSINPSTLNLQP